MRTKLLLITGIVSLSLMGCSGGGTATATATPAAPATAVSPAAP